MGSYRKIYGGPFRISNYLSAGINMHCIDKASNTLALPATANPSFKTFKDYTCTGIWSKDRHCRLDIKAFGERQNGANIAF